MDPFRTHGAISWPEMQAPDQRAAARFYAEVFGWELEEANMQDEPYFLGKVGGIPHAGMMKRVSDEIPPVWMFYVTVDDVDAVVSRVTELGGQIIAPAMTVPTVGRFCGFSDPAGAMIMAMAWESQGPDIDFNQSFVTPGKFSWFELRTPDVDAALSFYAELFGWEVEVNQMGQGPYHILKLGDTAFGGAIPPFADGIPAHWSAYLTVADADATAQAIAAAGGTVHMGPFEIETVGRALAFSDPQGAMLMAIQYHPPSE